MGAQERFWNGYVSQDFEAIRRAVEDGADVYAIDPDSDQMDAGKRAVPVCICESGVAERAKDLQPLLEVLGEVGVDLERLAVWTVEEVLDGEAFAHEVGIVDRLLDRRVIDAIVKALGHCPDALLLKACEKNSGELVKRLVELGAEVDVRDCRGRTALQLSLYCLSWHGSEHSAAHVLLEAGAHVSREFYEQIQDYVDRFLASDYFALPCSRIDRKTTDRFREGLYRLLDHLRARLVQQEAGDSRESTDPDLLL